MFRNTEPPDRHGLLTGCVVSIDLLGSRKALDEDIRAVLPLPEWSAAPRRCTRIMVDLDA